jgi:hypothetical protein
MFCVRPLAYCTYMPNDVDSYFAFFTPDDRHHYKGLLTTELQTFSLLSYRGDDVEKSQGGCVTAGSFNESNSCCTGAR